jgi:nucleotide-binding universal stress UspA family protein
VQVFIGEMTTMPGIIVGIDSSHHSERALEWAMKEAALRHQPLKILAVHPVITGWTGHGDPYPEDSELLKPTRAAAQEVTDKVLAGLSGPRPESVTVEVVSGIPAEVLLAAAADAEMIVVGSRGSGGFARLTMGSVGDQVARHAPCPVVIIPKAEAR